MTDLTPPLDGLRYQKVHAWATEGDYVGGERSDVSAIEEADVIISRVSGKKHSHKILLDLDLDAKLLPSSTPGHFHLYIDKEVSSSSWMVLMDALNEAGIIEPGYYRASMERGYTALRLPWVKKEEMPSE